LDKVELPPSSKFNIAEVQFKNSHKEFIKLPEGDFDFEIGDIVAVEAVPGHDIGVISLIGEAVKIQMKNKKAGQVTRKIYRRAKAADIEKWVETVHREKDIMMRSRYAAWDLNLNMKVNDVECQGDGTKAIFYYTSDDRVDFRELIKILAELFKIRIEMRQIGVRQEAARLGGIGSCGRELCCASWLNNFQSVSTSAARTQQLSPNPQKLAGQCGKLKCCLNYENETYLRELEAFPSTNTIIQTEKGKAV
jgi:cell fate regulator YaaT (PSP1 superfamily)